MPDQREKRERKEWRNFLLALPSSLFIPTLQRKKKEKEEVLLFIIVSDDIFIHFRPRFECLFRIPSHCHACENASIQREGKKSWCVGDQIKAAFSLCLSLLKNDFILHTAHTQTQERKMSKYCPIVLVKRGRPLPCECFTGKREQICAHLGPDGLGADRNDSLNNRQF